MKNILSCISLTIFRSKVNVFDLGSFLIKPVQRVLKYPLLINELVKLTDPPTGSEPSDLENLTKAAKLMNAVANDINEDKRTKDLGWSLKMKFLFETLIAFTIYIFHYYLIVCCSTEIQKRE